MHSRLALAYVLILALGTGVYAASTQMHTAKPAPAQPSVAQGLPSWTPNWLARSLSRAIADATDPRERDSSGAPKK